MKSPHTASRLLPQSRAASGQLTHVALRGMILGLCTVFAWGLGPDLAPPAEAAQRLKEVARIQGVRGNQLVGYGLVVGLDGSGDQTTQAPFTAQSMQSLLGQLGVQMPAGVVPQLKNTAAVVVTVELPAFAQPGQKLDITVSSIGNAKSLRGGTLLLTPLRGVDGEVYALAQGNMIVGGAGAAAAGSSVQINHTATGRIPQGASVERTVPNNTLAADDIRVELNRTDFGDVQSVLQAINMHLVSLRADLAQPVDARVIRVPMPQDPGMRIALLAQLENLPVTLTQPAARVVINARTGSVVMNQAVSLSTSAVAHGGLSVTVNTTPSVSQPAPLSQGQTVVTEQSNITVKQEGGAIQTLPEAAKLADVVTALNALGATPGDLIAILQALKEAGSLKAELDII